MKNFRRFRLLTSAVLVALVVATLTTAASASPASASHTSACASDASLTIKADVDPEDQTWACAKVWADSSHGNRALTVRDVHTDGSCVLAVLTGSSGWSRSAVSCYETEGIDFSEAVGQTMELELCRVKYGAIVGQCHVQNFRYTIE